ncbi:MAG: DUF2059 domain-containing protein [Leptolyngbya sp.]|nr:DUF2059 domain-containing protein [Candidatus Melainabacteria bacterium]
MKLKTALFACLLISASLSAQAESTKDSGDKAIFDKNASGKTAADMPATVAAQAKVTPEKREAIKKLMSVTRLPQVADKMYDMLLEQGQKSFTISLTRSIQEDTRYTEEQKRDLLANVLGSSERMFTRYRELLPKSVNLPDVLESVSTQVYDKYFTAAELNDISAFYQTPAGKKALDVLPQVMQESAQMTGEIITPKVREVVGMVLQEEKGRIEALEKAPAAKTNEPVKTETKK